MKTHFQSPSQPPFSHPPRTVVAAADRKLLNKIRSSHLGLLASALLILATLLSPNLVIAQSGWQAPGAPQPIDWQTDLSAAQTLAAQQQKLVLLHFTADWCHPCRGLETFVFSNPQVQRSFAANVIAVKIDVDEHPAIVKQYGVAGVPFDVAITPAGRVVSKRSSPREALVYNDMLQGFSRVIQELAGGENVALNQSLNELQDKMYSDNKVVQRQPLAPNAPTHVGAAPSFDSQELQRNASVNNPFATASAAAPSSRTQPLTPSAQANAKLIVPQPQIQTQFEPTANVANNLAINSTASANQTAASVQPKRIMNDRFFNDPGPANSPTASHEAAKMKTVNKQVRSLDTSANLTPSAAGTAASTQLASTPTAQVSHSESANGFKNSLAAGSVNDQVALHGKCPVTLLKEGRWADGKQQWGCVHRQRTYLFASVANLQEFQRDPDAFSPLLAGYDPVIFDRSGELVIGLEEHGVFMGKVPNQRVVLFSNPETRAEFQSNPRKYIETIRTAMEASGGSSSTITR